MDGDEIGGRGDVAVAQPEFPHIGIGHRHLHPRLHRADGVGKVGRRHVAAQQHLVADHQGADRVRIAVGELDRGLDLQPGCWRDCSTARSPCNTLRPCLAAIGGHLLEPLIDDIDAHAVGQPGQLVQILLDLGGRDDGFRVERRLRPAERGIGQAIKLFTG